MKKIIIVVLLLISANSFAQTGWVLQNSNTNFTLNSVFFINSSTGFIVGKLLYLKTTNGGATWLKKDSVKTFSCIKFFNLTTGIRGGFSEIERTTDCGETWHTTYFPPQDNYFNISVVNDSVAYANSYYSYEVYQTTNQGLEWTTAPLLPGGFSLFHFINQNTGWVIYNGGFGFSKTTDSGNKWIPIHTINMISTAAKPIFFINENTGWFTSSKQISKTTNGGINWQQEEIASNFGIHSVYFINENTGWYIFNHFEGKIYKTTNGGIIWKLNNDIAVPEIYDLFFINAETGWMVGENGMIAKTISGGVLTENFINNSEVPDKFYLSQNYPNPFNPTTSIEFSLPQKSFVKLKVFDLLGREIANLVNENLSAGKYKYDFNAAALPSGIYFYKLETENFSETRKMVLVK